MITLKNIRGRNFRKHREFNFDFHKGVNAIVGPNGSGKSSIVEAILFLFTGKVDDGTKEEAITLGQTSGYVTGSFELNGKEGTLERHLDATKVLLTYDGKKYNKTSEVKEVWDKLLNINTEIFQKLVIAGQGEIPLLFKGDKATRAAVFQKIFLVPNVGKLRDSIWNDYIKQLPPLLAVEDPLELTKQITTNMESLVKAQDKLKPYESVSLSTLKDTENKIALVTLDKLNFERRQLVQKELKDLEIIGNNQAQEVLNIEAKLNSFPLKKEGIKKYLDQAILAKNNLTNKINLQNKLKEAQDKVDLFVFTKEDEKSLIEHQESKAHLSAQYSILNKEIADLAKSLRQYDGLRGHTNCPTCKQEVSNVFTLVVSLSEEKTKKETQLEKIVTAGKMLTKPIDNLQIKKETFETNQRSVKGIQQQIDELGDVSYDIEEHTVYQDMYTLFCKVETSLTLAAAQLETTRLLYVEKNELLSNIDPVEILDFQQVISELNNWKNSLYLKIQEKSALESDVRVLEAKLEDLRDRYKVIETNQEKNDKITGLNKTLLSMYDVFHPTTFSKKVIQKYSQVVTEYLQVNIAKFNFPYSISINEEFNIDVKDQDGGILPKVSGGQAMVIGLSLRLALLQLFAQSFGFIVIDEGTNALDTANQDSYFEVIKGLSDSQLEQVIIIDHNSKLSEVVDHVIQLT